MTPADLRMFASMLRGGAVLCPRHIAEALEQAAHEMELRERRENMTGAPREESLWAKVL